jgi:DNA-binding NarL/FixJ family response regulator
VANADAHDSTPPPPSVAREPIEMNHPPAIEVVIADEQKLMREAYQHVLDQPDEFNVWTNASHADEFDILDPCATGSDRILLMGCALVTQKLCGRLLSTLRVNPDWGMVLIFEAIASDAKQSFQTLSVEARSGFAAVKRKSIGEGEDLRRLVRQVHAGQVVLDSEMMSELVGRGNPRGDQAELARLTDREMEVLALMARGLNNATVAGELAISRGTVDRHTYNIYQKFPGCPAGTQPRAYATAVYREYCSTEALSGGHA